MARPSAKRTALLLYGILLVLPAVVLGGLHWHQLWLDHQLALSNLPLDASATAERLAARIREPLEETLRQVDRHSFAEFAPLYAEGEQRDVPAPLVAPPLAKAPSPPGVLGWFGADLRAHVFGPPREASPAARANYVRGADPRTAADEWLAAAADAVVQHNVRIGFFGRTARLTQERVETVPWQVLAAFLSQSDPATGAPLGSSGCYEQHGASLFGQSERVVTTHFFLEVIRGPEGEPILSATRRVLPEEMPRRRDGLGACGRELVRDFYALQGVLLDPLWLLGELPNRAAKELPERATLLATALRSARSDEIGAVHALELLPHLGFVGETDAVGSEGTLRVGLQRVTLDRTFRAQVLRFLGVAAMLILSLGTGLGLLLFSVNRELERVERTRNFLAAVTHELRTPLSTIALHTEMLLEGWAGSPEKQREYYERIDRETKRLSTLVERVLEKTRLSEGPETETDRPKEVLGDLSEAVAAVKPLLLLPGGSGKGAVDFQLAAGLPPVRFSQEAITSIVVNLVENARKYAPVPEGGEPILVRTGADPKQVWLEVADRGPGIPPKERTRIFEAFYRVGNEATRTSTGTGLGLHLVDLQARALGGSAQVLDRPGGGAIFKVVFPRPAADTSEAS